MELRDYLRALRRRWPIVLVAVLLGIGAALAYLQVAPKHYTASSVVVLTTNDPQTITDVQLGNQFSTSAAPTVAAVIESPAVLDDVANDLGSDIDTADLLGMVSASARAGTSIIDITVTSNDPDLAADIANRTAASAKQVIPALQAGSSATGDSPIRIDVVRPATVPTEPSSPNAQGVLLIGFIVGLAVGLAILIARTALDRRVRDSGSLAGVDLPVLISLPRESRATPGTITVRDRPKGRGAEAYRSLRTRLLRLDVHGRRSVVITAVSWDATSVVALNLALSVAQAGRRTVLVDADLHDPSIAAALGMEEGVGLADALSSGVDLGSTIRATDLANLWVVSGGARQASPTDLLAASDLSGVIAWLESGFDYVVVYAPPFLAYSDAALVARATGSTLFTVAIGRDTAEAVADAAASASSAGTAPLGIVLVDGRHGHAVRADASKAGSTPPAPAHR